MDGKQSLHRATPTATSSARNLSSTPPGLAIKWQLLLREKAREIDFGPPMNTDKNVVFLSAFIGVHRRL
jgi:hypothetical protein